MDSGESEEPEVSESNISAAIVLCLYIMYKADGIVDML